jgi:hypothetical protein
MGGAELSAAAISGVGSAVGGIGRAAGRAEAAKDDVDSGHVEAVPVRRVELEPAFSPGEDVP